MSLSMRRRCIVPAALCACLATGCQAGTSAPAVAGPTGAPMAAAAAPAASPIAVTVAPAQVAPGAVHSGMPLPTAITVPSTPPKPATYVAVCAPYLSPKQIPLAVSPGSGSATVTWRSDGDTTVAGYRVSAVSQRLVAGSQQAPVTATSARGGGCTSPSVTLSGLGHQVSYVFWLEEAHTDPVTKTLRYTMVGQSAAVLVP